MKKEYTRPHMMVEEYTANEYVAACGDSGTTYKFKCNAGSKSSKYVVHDSNCNPLHTAGHYVNGSDWYYHPCDEEHTASDHGDFLTGYHMHELTRTSYKSTKIPVTVWTANNTNVHCTTILDKKDWEIAKS